MDQVIEFTEKYINQTLGFLNVSPSVEVKEDNNACHVDIQGDDLNFLIGFRGESLEGLHHFLSIALFREFGEWKDLAVDVNDYRRAKREKLEEMARSFIDRVRFFTEEVDMPPMSAYERKQIHEFVNTYDDVETYSIGEGFGRHIVLKPIES